MRSYTDRSEPVVHVMWKHCRGVGIKTGVVINYTLSS